MQIDSTNKNQFHPMSKTTNSQGLTGMCKNGKTKMDFETVSVSDEIREKILNIERNQFLNNYGMSDGEEVSAAIRKYLASTPESQRLNVSKTLGEISMNEAQRLTDLAKTHIPNFQAGKPFDRNSISSIITNTVDRSI